jgi:poly-gamma-glutamate synthesis protein (capsule biosynthesis protein)
MKFQLHTHLLIFFVLLLSYGCSGENSKTALSPASLSASATEVPQIESSDTPTHAPTQQPTTPTATAPPPSNTPSPTETPAPSETPEPPITKLLFTGAIVPGRCVQAAIDERGDADFLYDDVRDIITKADIAVGTLNAALSDYPPYTGCIKTFVLVGSPENADAMARAGFDVMSVATNHIKNCGVTTCGDRAFLDTMDNLERVGILPVGAGDDIEQAMQPVVVEKNGIYFGFVSLGEIEALAFASQDSPGIAPLPQDFEVAEANLRAAISAAREVSDVVIAMPHWGSDYSATPNYRQLFFDQVAVDAGADLVIGNHPHVIQGMREIEGIPVFYSLGSFVFDQDWSRETQQGIIVIVTFQGTTLVNHEVIPVHIDGDGHVQIAESPDYEEILARFEMLSEKLE